jgi:regulator of protease activity HflC (stomatin/prohibitin superfamily)
MKIFVNRCWNRCRQILTRIAIFIRAAFAAVGLGLIETFTTVRGRRVMALLVLGAGAGALVWAPPLQNVEPGVIGVRVNRLTGDLAVMPEGPAMVLPLLHHLRRYPLRDQIYRPEKSARSDGDGAFQSIEGLSLGVDVTVRYALDPERVTAVAKRLPENMGRDLIEPTVDGVIHRALARHTVREIFTEKRIEIQDEIQAEVAKLLNRDGVLLRGLFLGHVDLPEQYRVGLEGLLAEELATQKMKYTLELKAKKVDETRLESEATNLQREKAAEAAGLEQIIAAKARAEAMKHVLPLKEKEIEQRRLEAEARNIQRTKDAEGDAAARRIESTAEAEARRKLSEADAYRIEVTGKANSEQMARDSALIQRNPLLIQKALADKLSDKIQVIIAPPSSNGFFAGGLLGMNANAPAGAGANSGSPGKQERQ